MKRKIIISIILCVVVIGGFLGYKVLNNPMDTLNYATWDKVPEDTRQFFGSFFQGDMEKGKQFYDNYFMKFNPVHEVSHALREKYNVSSDLYEEEQSVNDLTVAYWRARGEEAFIEELGDILKSALSSMENPVPSGQDPGVYFNENYHNLGDKPELYGYFQFTFVLNAMEKEAPFYEVLKDKVTVDAVDSKAEVTPALNGNKVDLVAVVESYLDYLKLYGIDPPVIKYNNKFRATIQSID